MPRPKTRLLLRRSIFGLLGACAAAGFVLYRRAYAGTRLAQTNLSWTIFYGEDISPAEFEGFDLVVLDSGFKGQVESVASTGREVLGYLSLGEIRRTSTFFPQLTDLDVLLTENALWPDTYLCDVRRPAWRSFILDTAIPELQRRGFTGLFFDTLDTPPYLEQKDPERYGGMRNAAIDLVRTIRSRFPRLTLLMNRGYALLPELRSEIDGIVAESLLTTYDFKTNTYKWVEASELEQHMQFLRPLLTEPNAVPILSLDYWDQNDQSTIREIYIRERALGHRPYVAQVLLDRVIRESASAVQ